MEKGIEDLQNLQITGSREDVPESVLESETFDGSLGELFDLPSKDWMQYAPLTLAYIGDAAYELVIRTVFVRREDAQTWKLHRKVTSCVSAKTQARMIGALLPYLTEEEASVYRRGRNSKPYTKAKNATLQEYLEATGFEAVIGYLYLEKRFARMNELIAKGLKDIGAACVPSQCVRGDLNREKGETADERRQNESHGEQ